MYLAGNRQSSRYRCFAHCCLRYGVSGVGTDVCCCSLACYQADKAGDERCLLISFDRCRGRTTLVVVKTSCGYQPTATTHTLDNPTDYVADRCNIPPTILLPFSSTWS